MPDTPRIPTAGTDSWPSPPLAASLPHKVSLAAQTAGILRSALESGQWGRWLPGEHELSGQLHVSRVTLRRALDQLRREGWLRSSQGRRREILHAEGRGRPAASTRVVLLTASPVHTLHPFAIYWMDCLRGHLAEAGYHLEIHARRAAFGSHVSHTLQAMGSEFQPAAWVLYRSTEQIQRWFSERGFACLITGSRHAGIDLPSVDIDYRATCRHAAGQFFGRGHRQLVLLNPESGAAGDLESEQGFLEAVAQKGPAVSGVIVRHDGTVTGICNRLDQLFKRPVPPTAFLVSRPTHVLTVVGCLMHSGLRFARDVALISRDDDSFLEAMVPTVARYSSSPTIFASKVSKVVLDLVRRVGSPRSDMRIMPHFVPGQTLG